MAFNIDKLEKEVEAKVKEAAEPQEQPQEKPKAEEQPTGKEPETPVETASQEPAEKPVEQAPQAPEKDPELEARLKMLDKEVKRLANENRHLTIELSRRETPEPPAENKPSGMTDGEREMLEDEGFTDDLLDLLAKRLRPEAPQFDDTLAERVSRVEHDVASTRKTEFEKALTKVVPDWEKINESAVFVNWLQDNRPEFSTASFQEVINHLGANGDVEGVAKVFNLFKASTGARTTSDQRTTQDQRTTKYRLEDEVAPRPSGSAHVEETPGHWDRERVKQFYDDLALGKYTDKEAEKLEAELLKAR